ncbi:hypothetical protein [Neobacillus soli]|uniref:hypothetical protein n=1 Tax=Neobacillus soli TaxID=220688 RepID=UPI000826ABB9|nr:hypothetical protein [Neobacillus soli]
MPTMKMKEINTPLKPFGIRYFKDIDGLYYKKTGKNSRKAVRPFWRKKRMVLGIPILLVVVVIGMVGYEVGIKYASQKVVNEIAGQLTDKDIAGLLKDPTVQQSIENEIGSDQKDKLLKKYSLDSKAANGNQEKTVKATAVSNKENKVTIQHPLVKKTPRLKFRTKEEVTKFLLSKFTMNELSALAKKAEGGITPAEKAEIKNTVLKRLSAEEYEAVKTFAFIELSKR